MELKVVAVYDNATGAFGRPFFVRAHGEAIRMIQDQVNQPQENNALHSHPEHFSLWDLGTYNDETARFTPPNGEYAIKLTDATALKTGA